MEQSASYFQTIGATEADQPISVVISFTQWQENENIFR